MTRPRKRIARRVTRQSIPARDPRTELVTLLRTLVAAAQSLYFFIEEIRQDYQKWKKAAEVRRPKVLVLPREKRVRKKNESNQETKKDQQDGSGN